jgi:glycosyltransferase involved in cell wall biosynthesis
MASLVNCANRVFVSTGFLADILIRHGVSASRVRVVPYGVELGKLPDKVSLPLQFSSEYPLRLGFIGSLVELKGPHIILEALRRLGEKSRLICFDCYGPTEPAEPYVWFLREQARRVQGTVRFEGTFEHKEIGRVLRTLHLLVIPSLWYESAPLVLCSALSAGVPVLVSALGGLTEAVSEGASGLAFPAGDAAALAERIAALLENPALLRRLHQGAEGHPRTIQEYVNDIEAEYLTAANS